MAMGLRWVLRHVYLRRLGVAKSKANQIVAASEGFKQELRTLKFVV